MMAWASVELAEVCTLITDGTHHSPTNLAVGDYKYVTAKNIRPWGLDISNITYVDTATHQGIYARCPVEYGDVLYIKDGVTTGIAALNTLEEPFSMLSSVALLKPERSVLEPRYLKHWLNSPVAYSSMTGEMTGTAIKRLVLKQIRATSIQLAPLPEQKRIADKLDSVLTRVDACRDRLDRLPALLKRFRQSILAAATSGRLTEDWQLDDQQNWSYERAAEVCAKVQSGGTPKEGFVDQGIPFLKVYNIVDQKVAFDYRPQFIEPSIHCKAMSKSQVAPGDVLMNIVGPPLGKVAIVPDTYQSWNINQAITLFRPSERITTGWLYCILCGGENIKEIVHETKGSAGQTNISLSQCRDFIFPVPPLPEQTEIVRRVELLFAFADRLEARLANARKQVDQLTPALLAKAFRGELVAQDPADEPAAELLKRLAAQRAAAPKVKRGRSPA